MHEIFLSSPVNCFVRPKWRALMSACALIFAAMLSLAAAPRAESATPAPVAAIAARLEQNTDKARLVFETTSELDPTAYAVINPNRIIVDLPEVAFMIDPSVGRLQAAHRARRKADRLIKSYRFGLFALGRSRIVIDLERPAKIMRTANEMSPAGPQLVIELARSDPESFAAAAAEHARAAPPPSKKPVPPAPPADKPVVVIDPGHGGVDVGAAGAHGEQEKAIVFEFAQALQAKIEAGGRLHAILTREEDVFVALDDRVRFAKQNNAALFLSIHADTLGAGSVHGATIYTASAKASDAEAQRIAEKENLADQAAGLERKEDAEEVGDILFDLTRRETRAYSRQFSKVLVNHWKDAGSLNKNPSRSAGFVVLKAHDIPSVLLELGYLSSEKDIANLTSPQWREQTASATASAIESFFAGRGLEPLHAAPAVAATVRPQ
jgi:N-acetylmuramoyl-L-alanine amidase